MYFVLALRNNKGDSKFMSVYREEQIYGIVRRKNVASVFFMSLALFLFSLFSFVLRNIFVTEGNKVSVSLMVITIVISFLFLLISTYVLRTKQKNTYKSTYSTFWIAFYILFITAGFSATKPLEMLLIFAIMLILASLVPIFVKGEFVVFAVSNLSIATAITFLKELKPEIVSFVFVFVFLCSLLSYIRYKNFMLNTRYKTQLRGAIKMSETDKMTGLLNRRGLERCIESLWPHWIREKKSVAFLMIDIDFFKKYNDEFGHVMGDECIKKISQKIGNAVRRKTDFAARVGGEEFIICLSGIEGKDSILWAKRLKAEIEALEIRHASSSLYPCVTVSMGLVCEKPLSLSDFDLMYDAADKSLYNAKEFGRACIVYNNKCYDQRYISDFRNISINREKLG